MSNSIPTVTIFGGSGFVGRYISRRMAKAGWRVRVATRRPNDALFVRTYGNVGQVEPIFANIRDDNSVRAALIGSDAVVNCVGVLVPRGKQTFQALHAEGAGRIARIAAAEKVSKFVHLSSIGADAESESLYSQSKAEGETGVLAAFPKAIILRPSVIFGTEDDFFNRFATIARLTPVLPIAGADSKFQPVYVDDIAQVVEKALVVGITSGVYELGGPDVETLRQLMQRMADIIRRKRLIINMPFFVAGIQGFFFETAHKLTGGLIPAWITRDQVRALAYDNIVSDTAKSFKNLNITPTAMDEILDGYLYSYRDYGQYSEITASAKNLRKAP